MKTALIIMMLLCASTNAENNINRETEIQERKPAVSAEYLAEMGYNTQTNEWPSY